MLRRKISFKMYEMIIFSVGLGFLVLAVSGWNAETLALFVAKVTHEPFTWKELRNKPRNFKLLHFLIYLMHKLFNDILRKRDWEAPLISLFCSAQWYSSASQVTECALGKSLVIHGIEVPYVLCLFVCLKDWFSVCPSR